MPYLNILGFFLGRRWSGLLVWLVALTCALGVVGCASTPHPIVMEKVAQGLLRKVCWLPQELDPKTKHFVFLGNNGAAVSDQDKAAFASAVVQAGLIYEYDKSAPVENLRLIPLTRPDAWCADVLKPTDEAVLRLFDPCAEATAQGNGSAPKNLLAQSNVTEHSSYYCNQNPQMPPTSQQLILRREREAAFMAAFRQARVIGLALTQAQADMLRVINNDDSWLKRLLTEDPGTLEQIQQRVANQLDSIEPPPEYNNTYLDTIALMGFRVGFEDGKFEVENKLFLIDVGVTLIEFAVLELATAGVGGVAATAARAGAKAAQVATSAGGKALIAAMKRLENVPIFIPAATGGVGTYVTVGQIIKAARTSASKKLADAMKTAGIKRPDGTDAHHIVAIGHRLAQESRDILAKFGVKLDQAENGVFLPSNLKSPNPKGAIVHATLANKYAYYDKVNSYLRKAQSQKELLTRLHQIRKTLLDGTFYDAIK